MSPGPVGIPPGHSSMLTPIQSHSVNPATNDAPLEFNTNKNKPPMPVSQSKYHK